MFERETDNPNFIDDIAIRHRYAKLAELFGYRPISYTEITHGGWYTFRGGIFWLVFVENSVLSVHVSSLGNPDPKFLTSQLEKSFMAEARILGAQWVVAEPVEPRLAHKLRRMGWTLKCGDFWRKVDEQGS